MNLAYIPSPGFSKFSIGPVTIHMYAICILTGIIFAVWILTVRWKKNGGTFDQVLDTTLVAVPCGLVGARLYHCITTPDIYFPPTGNLINILKVWEGGMAIFGGIGVGALAAFLWCRHRRYPFALLADCIAPALMVAQAIGRLGNWFNQELYGMRPRCHGASSSTMRTPSAKVRSATTDRHARPARCSTPRSCTR